MIVESFFDEGLGNSSYLVAADTGTAAALIDPDRDVDRYLAAAEQRGMRITHVLETHLHADFVSGSRELAARTGAQVLASAEAQLAFPHRGLGDQEEFEAGGLRFRALATPGHTPEHLCFLVCAASGTPEALFSGGALLVGSVARTDLIAPERTDGLTRALYHSLHEGILPLPDEVVVLPTHGAGSFCAAATQDRRSTTIGQERRNNALLQAPTEAAFVARALHDLPPYPDYFRRMRALNRAGPAVLGHPPELAELSPETARKKLQSGALLIDTRSPEAFDTRHLAGAVGIPLTAAFGTWVGWVIPPDVPLILAVESREATPGAVRQLLRVGYERLEGYLAVPFEGWQEWGTTASTARVPIDALGPGGPQYQVLDVRERSEWSEGHIPGALSIPLSELRQRTGAIPTERPLVVHCAHEFRSTIAGSLLQRAGFEVSHLIGGFEAWRQAGKPVEAPAPSPG